MTSYCNREKAAESFKLKNEQKRLTRFVELKPFCKICERDLTFEEYKKGRRDFCGSKQCRSIVNKTNGDKQDKTKISEQIKSSEKWINAQRETLTKRRSKIESCFVKMFTDLYDDVRLQHPIKTKDGSNKFIDIVVNGTFVEIDGPFHSPERNAALDEYVMQNNIQLIRINVTEHWMDILSNIGSILRKVNKE